MTAELIPPSQIQSELSRIWDALEGGGKTRASLFNLIFFTRKNARAGYIEKICDKVLEKFPSRVIYISAEEGSKTSYLNTSVSVLPSNALESDIACDHIKIDVAGKHCERVPFVILPHILPDLPIYVIWAEDPTVSSPLFTQLEKLATRMIFDSEAMPNLPKFAEKLLSITKGPCRDVADLNWARMESWRDLLTSTFYTDERLARLKNTSKIQILYNAKESKFCAHTSIQALYLQGWLASQLGWKMKGAKEEDEKLTLLYDREGGSLEITLFPEWQETVKAGSIVSVDLETAVGEHFSFGRDLNHPNLVSMRFSTLEKCDIPLRYIFAKDESGRSLVNEICKRGTSVHFENLLNHMKDHKEYGFCEH